MTRLPAQDPLDDGDREKHDVDRERDAEAGRQLVDESCAASAIARSGWRVVGGAGSVARGSVVYGSVARGLAMRLLAGHEDG